MCARRARTQEAPTPLSGAVLSGSRPGRSVSRGRCGQSTCVSHTHVPRQRARESHGPNLQPRWSNCSGSVCPLVSTRNSVCHVACLDHSLRTGGFVHPIAGVAVPLTIHTRVRASSLACEATHLATRARDASMPTAVWCEGSPRQGSNNCAGLKGEGGGRGGDAS